MQHILWSERLGPGSEFEHDAVGILEVHRPHEHTRMQLGSNGGLAVVMIEDHADVDPFVLQLGDVLIELVLGHVECQMIHRTVC